MWKTFEFMLAFPLYCCCGTRLTSSSLWSLMIIYSLCAALSQHLCVCNMNLRSEKWAHKSKLRQWQLAVSKMIIIPNYRCAYIVTLVACFLLLLILLIQLKCRKSVNYVGLISKICIIFSFSLTSLPLSHSCVMQLIRGKDFNATAQDQL